LTYRSRSAPRSPMDETPPVPAPGRKPMAWPRGRTRGGGGTGPGPAVRRGTAGEVASLDDLLVAALDPSTPARKGGTTVPGLIAEIWTYDSCRGDPHETLGGKLSKCPKCGQRPRVRGLGTRSAISRSRCGDVSALPAAATSGGPALTATGEGDVLRGLRSSGGNPVGPIVEDRPQAGRGTPGPAPSAPWSRYWIPMA